LKPFFWPHCGYETLGHGDPNHAALEAGGAGASPSSVALLLSDDFLRMLLQAPELAPIAESCPAELALHAALLADPKRAVSSLELKGLRDPDAAENYGVWLRFRTRLMARPSLEGAYLALFEGQGVDVPPKFVHQLTQVLLRHVLSLPSAEARPNKFEASPMHVRAAEMLFRTQKVTVSEDGAVMAADEETVEKYATTGGFGSLGELLKKADMPTRTIDLDVLNVTNADEFWSREKDNLERFSPGAERYEWVLQLNHGSEGLSALCEVMERWIEHFLGVKVKIKVEKKIDDPQWLWHVGLDAQASSILNDLYTGKDVDEERLSRLLCLFSLHFENANDMSAELRGHPVYLAMAMDEHKRMRLKPQNLLLNLPLAKRS
jgi:Family of unknown function (DUF6352)